MPKKAPVGRPPRPKSQPRLVLLHKPYRVLCQFSPDGQHRTLADVFADPVAQRVADVRGLYPAGRLDHDSEGLLLLTNHGPWQARISEPRHKLVKTYLAQVEGEVSDQALDQLRAGIVLKDGPARAITARRVAEPPDVFPRQPPVRFRAHIPTDWLALTLDEGRNRQVRRMTAAVGLPTLRLIRTAIGPWRLAGLAPGESREWPADDVFRLLE